MCHHLFYRCSEHNTSFYHGTVNCGNGIMVTNPDPEDPELTHLHLCPAFTRIRNVYEESPCHMCQIGYETPGMDNESISAWSDREAREGLLEFLRSRWTRRQQEVRDEERGGE